MLLQAILPCSALQSIVERYWISESVIPAGQTFKLEGIPNGSQNILFNYGTGRLLTTINDKVCTYTAPVIAGQLSSKSFNYFQGEVNTFAIQFKPTGFFNLFGIPMQEFNNVGMDLEAVIGREGKQLDERIREAKTTGERVQIIEHFLLSQLVASTHQVLHLDKLVRLIGASRGTMTVEQMASQVHMTRRTFERHFAQKTGLLPKFFARIIRFYWVRRALQLNSSLTAYDLIERFGYFDQSHLLKDFHFFADQTFSSYLATDWDFDNHFLSTHSFVTFLQGLTSRGELSLLNDRGTTY